MAFFLSKLLPVFFYPLGLAICLLIFALVSLIRLKRRPAIAAVSTAFVILYISSTPILSVALVRSLEYQNIPSGELPTAEAIVVLGGGTEAQIYPRPWVEVGSGGDRILYGSRLWIQKKAPLLILAGGRTSLLGKGGRAESTDMAEIAEAFGVKRESILEDPDSLNTYENGVNVKKILEKLSLNKILLVTSAIHMPRSLAIFRKLGMDAIAAPTDFNVVEGNGAPNIFNFLPDAEILKDTTNALKEYLGIVIYKLYGWL